VWVVAAQSQTVSLRDVDVVRYDAATVVISRGLEAGELVVTAGVQMLRPNQKVRVLGAAS
jgi:multidrug efflux pump subunit AcrA (membrane-fusion protein)